MKRHICRHCGLALDMYAELRRHVESHSTPAVNEHSYSVAQPAAEPPSDHAKRTKYSCKCDATFGRWDDLQHHLRSVCRLSRKKTTVYTCTKCGKKFNRRDNLTRHARSTCTDVKEPPSPKRSNREDTTPHHPLVTDEDPIDPPARLPFADNLSTELLDVVRAHWSTVRTRVTRGPLQYRYDYRLTTLDTTVLETPLKKMFQEQTNAFKINLSEWFILRNKNTGRYKYYHSSCNCCGRYLDEPSLITSSKDFDDFLERIQETDVLQWAINQRPDSAWVCELVTNVTFLEKEPNNSKRYSDNLCLFRCLALHRGGDVRRLEPAVKTLYEAYAQNGVPMEEFDGVTVDDLYRVETTFQRKVCVYSLVKPDGEDGKPTVELVRRSICKYPDTLYLNLHETHFSSRMYASTVTRIDVGSTVSRCGKTHGSYANTRARVREVCVESILVACTIRLHRYSNGWTTRTSEWPNRCGTIRTEPPSTLSVGSTPNNFLRTVTRFTGLRVTSR